MKYVRTLILMVLMASLGIWLSNVPFECREYAPRYLIAGAGAGFIIGLLFSAASKGKN